jgi:cytochrome c
MKTQILAGLAVLALAAPALAEGDAAKGEATFKKCKACHSIVAPDGTEIVKGGKVGPDLYGVIGRAAASVEGFNYGEGIQEAAGKGLVWDEASVAEYVQNPTAFLDKVTGDAGAKSKMSFKLAKGGEDVAAYLASVAPAAQ